MRIWAVDDEEMALAVLTRSIEEAIPDARLTAFRTVSGVPNRLSDGLDLPDVVFLDIELPGMTGLELARRVKSIAPNANAVFMTGYSQYALEALAIRPSGYVMKPVDVEQIRRELRNLRNPPAKTVSDKRICVQCFGDFEIFVNGRAVAFPRTKSKEMLAYLVDRRGANCSTAKIAEALWEDGVYDRARQKLLSTIYTDMMKALERVNAAHIVKKTNSLIAVDPKAFDCDYYQALSGDIVSINSFMGEYMASYSWAEFTTATLSNGMSAEIRTGRSVIFRELPCFRWRLFFCGHLVDIRA